MGDSALRSQSGSFCQIAITRNIRKPPPSKKNITCAVDSEAVDTLTNVSATAKQPIEAIINSMPRRVLSLVMAS